MPLSLIKYIIESNHKSNTSRKLNELDDYYDENDFEKFSDARDDLREDDVTLFLHGMQDILYELFKMKLDPYNKIFDEAKDTALYNPQRGLYDVMFILNDNIIDLSRMHSKNIEHALQETDLFRSGYDLEELHAFMDRHPILKLLDSEPPEDYNY